MLQYLWMAEIRYKTNEEVWNWPIKSYTVNVGEKAVEVMPKIPEHHQSYHPLEQSPTVFYNIDQVLLNPDDVLPDSSNELRAIESRKKGEVKIYLKNNFIKNLKIPGYSDWKDDEMRVVVMYEKTGKNYTKTYRITKK